MKKKAIASLFLAGTRFISFNTVFAESYEKYNGTIIQKKILVIQVAAL